MNSHDPRAARPAPGLSRKWIDRLAQHLLRHAARRAPPVLAERLEEEWLADMAARHTALARLRLSIGCHWAASVIAHQHRVPNLATASVRGARTLAAYAQDDKSFFSRRSAAVIVILALHAVIIYILAAGIVHGIKAKAPPPTTADVTTEPSTRHPPPPLAGPTFVPRTTIDIPEPYFPTEAATGDGAITVPARHDPPAPIPLTIHVQRVPGGPGKGFPNTADFYPDGAIRLHEEGTVAVQVCVSDNGRLTAAPAIAQSSGSPRLDGGALALARAGSGHYRPSTEDGRAVSACFPLHVRFQLKN